MVGFLKGGSLHYQGEKARIIADVPGAAVGQTTGSTITLGNNSSLGPFPPFLGGVAGRSKNETMDSEGQGGGL